MKKYLSATFFIILLFLAVLYNDNITNNIANYFNNEKEVYSEEANEYFKNENFKFVSLSEDYIPYSYNDLVDIIYTFLNKGWNNFTFYCPSEYSECYEDIKNISNNNVILTDINNFVHPYNNFQSMNTSMDSSGEITISIKKIYSEEQINSINNKVKDIESSIYEDDMDIIDKLKAAHDYIINNSNYDLDRRNNQSEKYQSNIAYGPLIEGYAICSGYADAMAIFITNLGVKNFKVASESHVWNAVYINDEWLHIDPTWDDQIDTNGNEKLIHKFFLINTENLLEYAPSDHEFKPSVYREFFE